jgi:regulator of protease activity HflC (stomatin/prohibitin superfamily)
VAERDAEAQVTAASGAAEATRIAAQAQADANRAVAASVTQEFIDYQRALALSQAETIYVPSDGTVLIGADR